MDPDPETDSKSAEIRADVAGIRVPRIQFAIQSKGVLKRITKHNWCNPLYQVIDAFVVEVATESLELGGQQDCVSVVDLLGRDPAAWPRPSHHAMRVLDLVEGVASYV